MEADPTFGGLGLEIRCRVANLQSHSSSPQNADVVDLAERVSSSRCLNSGQAKTLCSASPCVTVTDKPFRPAWRSRPYPREIHRDEGLVPDRPRVVARRDHEGVTRAGFIFGTIVHHDPRTPRDDITGMGHFATAGAGDRLDVFRPSPTRLQHGSSDRNASQRHDLGPTLLKWPRLVGASRLLVSTLPSDLSFCGLGRRPCSIPHLPRSAIGRGRLGRPPVHCMRGSPYLWCRPARSSSPCCIANRLASARVEDPSFT
jgi:hypothetical protein